MDHTYICVNLYAYRVYMNYTSLYSLMQLATEEMKIKGAVLKMEDAFHNATRSTKLNQRNNTTNHNRRLT